MATHTLHYVEFSVEARMADGSIRDFFFKRPVLKDCDEHRDVLDQKCYRERCKWEVDATTSSGAPISKVKKNPK